MATESQGMAHPLEQSEVEVRRLILHADVSHTKPTRGPLSENFVVELMLHGNLG